MSNIQEAFEHWLSDSDEEDSMDDFLNDVETFCAAFDMEDD